MTAALEDAMEQARHAASVGPDRLAERIGARASVTAVFGDPIGPRGFGARIVL
jgi:hypothetical protein